MKHSLCARHRTKHFTWISSFTECQQPTWNWTSASLLPDPSTLSLTWQVITYLPDPSTISLPHRPRAELICLPPCSRCLVYYWPNFTSFQLFIKVAVSPSSLNILRAKALFILIFISFGVQWWLAYSCCSLNVCWMKTQMNWVINTISHDVHAIL